MAIKKADLKDFVTQRIGEKIAKEQKMRKQTIKTEVTKYVTTYFDGRDLQSINKFAQDLHQSVNFFMGLVKDSYRMHSLSGAKSTLEQITERGLKTFLIDTLTQYISMGVQLEECELNRYVTRATNPHDQKVSELRKLENELLKVISANRTGDKAYKQLVELGVDLEGFKKEELQLPSVVKIDADVSLF
ncbi:hypothetical protein [Bacillus phage SPO1L4]|nr:hypothetical protein Goe10_c01820 [Bacillus phage vB_BsuM-Goe10]WIT26517.1 hypothetical protein [Bacillus phage SPO1L4]